MKDNPGQKNTRDNVLCVTGVYFFVISLAVDNLRSVSFLLINVLQARMPLICLLKWCRYIFVWLY